MQNPILRATFLAFVATVTTTTAQATGFLFQGFLPYRHDLYTIKLVEPTIKKEPGAALESLIELGRPVTVMRSGPLGSITRTDFYPQDQLRFVTSLTNSTTKALANAAIEDLVVQSQRTHYRPALLDFFFSMDYQFGHGNVERYSTIPEKDEDGFTGRLLPHYAHVSVPTYEKWAKVVASEIRKVCSKMSSYQQSVVLPQISSRIYHISSFDKYQWKLGRTLIEEFASASDSFSRAVLADLQKRYQSSDPEVTRQPHKYLVEKLAASKKAICAKAL